MASLKLYDRKLLKKSIKLFVIQKEITLCGEEKVFSLTFTNGYDNETFLHSNIFLLHAICSINQVINVNVINEVL